MLLSFFLSFFLGGGKGTLNFLENFIFDYKRHF